MKIYLLKQNVNTGFDTFDSCVVVASSPEEARKMHPREGIVWDGTHWADMYGPETFGWAYSPEDVEVEEIGVTLAETAPRVICSSFKAS